jgi:hypothetical protein
MASSASNVFAAQPKATGALRYAPLGTTAPTDASAALDVGWIDLGYIGEDGFTETLTRDTEKKKAFGGATVKVLQTDFANTFQFAFMESINADVLKRVFGEGNVTVSGANITVAKNKKVLPHESYVIDTEDGDNLLRTYIPDGQIIEVDDIVRVHTDTIMYTVTVEAFEDESGNNSYDFHYVDALASGS